MASRDVKDVWNAILGILDVLERLGTCADDASELSRIRSLASEQVQKLDNNDLLGRRTQGQGW